VVRSVTIIYPKVAEPTRKIVLAVKGMVTFLSYNVPSNSFPRLSVFNEMCA
jgi:hypothetical protein